MKNNAKTKISLVSILVIPGRCCKNDASHPPPTNQGTKQTNHSND